MNSCLHYGGIFIGAGAAEVLGDYGAGPNHVLPTGGTARYTGGLSVLTFLRVRTWMRIDNTGPSQELVRLENVFLSVWKVQGTCTSPGSGTRVDSPLCSRSATLLCSSKRSLSKLPHGHALFAYLTLLRIPHAQGCRSLGQDGRTRGSRASGRAQVAGVGENLMRA